ncbi:MAG: hypothetical protein IKZ28_03490, partial [Clostridia bacterium]|nr:hypothetical protein [Clostridia bacterium]
FQLDVFMMDCGKWDCNSAGFKSVLKTLKVHFSSHDSVNRQISTRDLSIFPIYTNCLCQAKKVAVLC